MEMGSPPQNAAVVTRITILKDCVYPRERPVSLYALHHHESVDGTGYPAGLKGQDIPLVSRIISVIDAYDAMVSNRCYRKGLPHEEAILRLLKASGTQFDAEVVESLRPSPERSGGCVCGGRHQHVSRPVAHPFIQTVPTTSGSLLFIAQLLVVFPPSLVAACEGLLDVHAGILALEFFDPVGHFRGDLVKLHAARARMESRFETQPVELFVVVEVPSGFQ